MTSNLGERGKDGSSWDEYFLTPEQCEDEAERFKDQHHQNSNSCGYAPCRL